MALCRKFVHGPNGPWRGSTAELKVGVGVCFGARTLAQPSALCLYVDHVSVASCDQGAPPPEGGAPQYFPIDVLVIPR
jgi:hypothetical protein